MVENGIEDTLEKEGHEQSKDKDDDNEHLKFAVLLVIVFLQLMLVIFRVGTCVLSLILIRYNVHYICTFFAPKSAN